MVMTPMTEPNAGNDARPGADTSWHLVRRAAADDGEGRSVFASHYLPVIRSYLRARWAGGPLIGRVDDAVQDVFLECYRDGGVLHRADEGRRVAFRAFLFGVIRNVALRFEGDLRGERQEVRASTIFLQALPGREASLSRVFDDAWARSLMVQAGELQRRWAESKTGAAARAAAREIELLELRFQDGLPVRKIAAQWGQDAQSVHRLYQKARQTFHECLRAVVRAQMSSQTSEGVDRECERLFRLVTGE